MDQMHNKEYVDRLIKETQKYPMTAEWIIESRAGEDEKVVGKFEQLLKQEYPLLDDEVLLTLSTGFREAVSNALYHGNLGVAREDYDKIDYADAKIQNDKKVVVALVLDKQAFTITIFDEGEGFNPAEVPDPLHPDNLLKTSGRGIHLYKSFYATHNIERAGKQIKGMKVTLTKEFEPGEFKSQE